MKTLFKRLLGLMLLAGGAVVLLLMNGLLAKLAATDPSCTEEAAVDGSIVAFMDTGVVPVCGIVASGSRVTWVNRSGTLVQIGSDSHPLHADNSEISDGKFVIQLEPGQSSSVVLTSKGLFGFHDHVKPALTGKIIIK